VVHALGAAATGNARGRGRVLPGHGDQSPSAVVRGLRRATTKLSQSVSRRFSQGARAPCGGGAARGLVVADEVHTADSCVFWSTDGRDTVCAAPHERACPGAHLMLSAAEARSQHSCRATARQATGAAQSSKPEEEAASAGGGASLQRGAVPFLSAVAQANCELFEAVTGQRLETDMNAPLLEGAGEMVWDALINI
jgi:hypothetical protein